MLSSENVGRSHQGTLFAAFGDGEHGEHGDDRFAAADVSLEQGVKLLFAAESFTDLVDGFRLPSGKRKR